MLGAAPAAAQPCEPHWANLFPDAEFVPRAGIHAIVSAEVGSGAAALYLGGTFTGVAGINASRIARWDAGGWHALGEGLDDTVNALAVFDDGSGPALYAGGEFQHAGRAPAAAIARWDGAGWQPVGSGLDGTVRALAVFDDGRGPALYAGGDFVNGPGHPGRHVARWDGIAWSPLGRGTDGPVHALAAFDDGSGPALYAGGAFTRAGAADAFSIARWDGAAWTGLATGMDGPVNALALFDDGFGTSLHAGGEFETAGGAAAPCVARWDGAAWSPLPGSLTGTVNALAAFDDGRGPALFAAGQTGIDGFEGIVRWDGLSWSPVGSEDPGWLSALAVHESAEGSPELVAGGPSALYRWNGDTLRTLDRGIGDDRASVWSVESFLVVPHDFDGRPALYVGGRFRHAGGLPANAIARWDGERWSALGEGIHGGPKPKVLAMLYAREPSGPALYAAGKFWNAGRLATGGIARWDGSTWSALGAPQDARVYALARFDDGSGPVVYAGGDPRDDDVHGSLVRWDGTAWSAISGMTDTVLALRVFDDGTGAALYVAGALDSAGRHEVTGIARWDGRRWSDVGGGIAGGDDPHVAALEVFDDGSGPALVAAGAFREAGGVPVENIARWNGSSWGPVGGGFDGPVAALAVLEGGPRRRPVLLAAGSFDSAGGAHARSIARWNGTFWSPLSFGVGEEANAVAVFDDGAGDGPGVFVGGDFRTAGGMPSQRIAKWIDCRLDELPALGACRYELTIVDSVSTYTFAGDLCDSGELAGKRGHSGWLPIRWSADEGVVDLPIPGGYHLGQANGINDAGQIVGEVRPGNGGVGRAVLWSGRGVEILDVPPQSSSSYAAAINDAGMIAGMWDNHRACIWQDGVMTDLSVDLGESSSGALGVSDRGQVVGWMGSPSARRAFIWDRGAVTDLGVVPGGTTARAVAINDRRQAVGFGRVLHAGEQADRAFLWNGEAMTDLGTLPGFAESLAMDINDSGVVVGGAWGDAGATAFIWRDGVMTDLNELIDWDAGVHLREAVGVNDLGQIVANGSSDSTMYHWQTVVVVLTPIAAPAGDVDGDCEVNGMDLVLLLFEWGPGPSPADLDGDGDVGTNDLLILLGEWMQG